MPRHKWWIITIQVDNSTSETPLLTWNPKLVKYAKYQLEEAPITGKRHIQGFIETFSSTKKKLGPESVLEPRGLYCHLTRCDDSTILENATNYASKEETALGETIEWGIPPTQTAQGTRNDLQLIKEAIAKKRPLEELIREEPDALVPYFKYHNGIEKAYKMLGIPVRIQPKTRQIEVWFYYGKPGTGKSYTAHQETNYFKKQSNTEWFCGYANEETLIIDEFTGWIYPSLLLQICDPYPNSLNVKQGYAFANWNKVIIISNYQPEFWYSHETQARNPDLVQAITRRFTKVVWFKTKEEKHTYENYEEFLNRPITHY